MLRGFFLVAQPPRLGEEGKRSPLQHAFPPAFFRMWTMDKILISSIDCVAAIGVTAEERTIKQRLSIDIEISVDSARAAKTDSLKDALDYSKVAVLVMDVCRSRDFHLIETLAELLAAQILHEFPTPQVR